MAFQHVVLCLNDVKKQQYIARLGFGENIDGFMSEFRFSSRYSSTVFHAALKSGSDLYIEDSGKGKIKESIPDWFQKISHAGSFILLPLTVSQRPLGLIYADHPRVNGMNLNGKQLNLMKALRNQIVLVFRSRN